MTSLGQPAANRGSGTRPSSSIDDDRPESYRRTARVVGVLYLAGMVIGIGGDLLIQSVLTAPGRLSTVAENGSLLAIGAVLWLATVVGDAAHGVLMFPILKRRSERMAVGYLTARIVDAIFIAVMTLLIVVQIPLGLEYVKAGPSDTASLHALSVVLTESNLYAYAFAMTALGVAGLILCSALFRSRLIPRPLAVWGLAGYAILLCGSVLEILGFNLGSIEVIPGGLWELFIGVWLIVKGFSTVSPSSGHSPSKLAVTTSNTAGTGTALVGSATT